MGNFLNLFNQEIDTIDSKYFYADHKITRNDRFLSIQTMFKDIGHFGIVKINNIVDEPKSVSEKYIYPICCLRDLNGLLRNEPESLFTPKMLHYLNTYKNFILFLINDVEFEDYETFKMLDEYVKLNNIRGSQIFMYNNNSKIYDYIKMLDSDIKFQRSITLHKFVVNGMIGYKSDFTLDKDFLFMMHNRSVRSHRYALLLLLKKNNILNNVDWSLINGWYFKKDVVNNGPNYILDFYNKVLDESDLINLTEEIKYFGDIDIKKSIYEESVSFGEVGEQFPDIDFKKTYEINGYSKSYINITTETLFERDEIHVTEKSFKPFYFNQIPIFVASYGHIKKLKEYYDFDFFDDLIDHSYDDELNPKKRLRMILNEIEKLNSDKEKVVNFYQQNKNRFLENQNKTKNILNNKSDFDFFYSLLNG